VARGSMIYAQTPYGQADAAFCALVAEILAWDMRRDVRSTAVLLAVCALTRVWPASHFTKKERAKWSTKAKAAFRVSESELSEISGASRTRVHTAVKAMREAGFVVELAPLSHRGEGRGTTPPTYALRCHVEFSDDSSTVSSISISSEGADQRSHASQEWDLQGA